MNHSIDSSPCTVPPARLPPLTRPARWLLAVVAALFVLAVACRYNGSSTGFWQSAASGDIRVRDAPDGVVLGAPRFTRGDEWFVWTPAILSQARQSEPFPVCNPALGPGVTPLLMSVPTRYYTTLLRPQLWGFFVAPFDYAFSWFWSCKVFGLFAGLFCLCWLLTDGRLGWAVFGALAIQFSGFVQWWFSTPAMLPEMLACWSVGIVAAVSFFLRRSWRWQLLSAGVFILSLANYLLCCYPAFEVPMLHLAACVVGGYVWQKRLFSWRGAGWLAGAFAANLLLLTPWLLRCLPTLQIEAHTVYPGQRHTYGGAMPLYRFLSGLFTLGMEERTVPPALENICEAANFYPLWLLPLTLGGWSFLSFLRRREGGAKQWLADRGMKILLAGYLTLLAGYALLPLPHWFCDVTLLSRTTEPRALLTLGVAGTLFVLLSLLERPATIRRPSRRAIWVALGWSVATGIFLLTARVGNLGAFLTPGRVAVFQATAMLAGAAYVCGPRWVLPTAWAGALVLKFALVNPVGVGLPALLESPAMNSLREVVQADPTAEWAVYQSLWGSELVKTSGARVVNGLRTIPDWDTIDRLDPAHQHLDKYNQYSLLCFVDAPYQADVPVSIHSLRYCEIRLHPRRMRELFPQVRYVASAAPLAHLAEAGFELIGSAPENHLWVYRLVAAPPAADTN